MLGLLLVDEVELKACESEVSSRLDFAAYPVALDFLIDEGTSESGATDVDAV